MSAISSANKSDRTSLTRSAASVHPAAPTLVFFEFANQIAAVPVESVRQIVPFATLHRPAAMTSLLEGFLNLSGVAVPVLRLDRLMKLPEQRVGLYSMLVVVQDSGLGRSALLVDRVLDIKKIPETDLLPAPGTDTLDACAEAVLTVDRRTVFLLSIARLLNEKERRALAEFRDAAQKRIAEWGVTE